MEDAFARDASEVVRPPASFSYLRAIDLGGAHTLAAAGLEAFER